MEIQVVQHTHGGIPGLPQLLVSPDAAISVMVGHYDEGFRVDEDDVTVDRDAAQRGDVTYLSTPAGRDEARWYRIDVPGVCAA